MAKKLQLRRGTTNQHSSFTGDVGEVTVDTDKDTVVVHDNSTAGGRPLAREDLNNVSSATIVSNIDDDAITYAKMQDIATANRVLGRASAGEIQEVQVATDMIADDAVTYGKMQDIGTANRVLGKASTGTVEEVQVATDMVADDAITYAKMQDIATANRVLGRASAGEIQEVQVATDMVANDAITYAKMQDLGTANRVLGGTATGAISEVQVAAAMIADEAVTEPKLATDAAGSTGQFLQKSGDTTMTWATVSTQAFPSGTKMLFNQTAAPTNWTKDTTNNNDSAIRVVTGTVGTGGSDNFSDTFGSGKATSGHTLTTAQMPSHTHAYRVPGGQYNPTVRGLTNMWSYPPNYGTSTGTSESATGGGGSHTHNLSNFNLKFVDVIVATAD